MVPAGRVSPAGVVRRAGEVAQWWPVAVGAVYLTVFVARFPTLVQRIYRDSDVAVFAVAAQTAHRGSWFALENFSSYTSWWFILATRWVPYHRQFWEVTPCFFALGAVALLAWASWRLAGGWAAAMAVVIGVATSPIVTKDRLTLNFHTAASMGAVVMAVFVLWLTQKPSRRQVNVAAVLVAVFAGTTLASDPLFLVVGLLPFALTGAVLLRGLGLRFEGLVVLGCSVCALPVAIATTRIMTSLHFVVTIRPDLALSPVGDLWSNVKRMAGLIVQLANGNYTGSAWLRPAFSFHYLLALVCAVLMAMAVAAPFLLSRRAWRAPARSDPLVVWGAFWSLCVAGNCASYALSHEGTQFGYYLITVLYAVGATVPILLSTSTSRRIVGGLAIGVVAAASLSSLTGNIFGDPWRLSPVANRILAIAKAEHAPTGYADYFDAPDLTWSSRFAVQVKPVLFCKPDILCPLPYNVVSTWFRPQSSRSFILQDRRSQMMTAKPPKSLGPPSATFALGHGFTMYVYPYDVASRLDLSDAVWR